MSILVVGSVAFDDVTSPSGSVKNVLAGAATYFSLAASYFTKVRVVAVVGDDFGPDQEKVFQQHGIDIRGIERAKGKTFRWGGTYTDNGPADGVGGGDRDTEVCGQKQSYCATGLGTKALHRMQPRDS